MVTSVNNDLTEQGRLCQCTSFQSSICARLFIGLFCTVVLGFKVCNVLSVAIGSKKMSCLHCLADLTLQSVREEVACFSCSLFAAHSSVLSLCRRWINTGQRTKRQGREGSGTSSELRVKNPCLQFPPHQQLACDLRPSSSLP